MTELEKLRGLKADVERMVKVTEASLELQAVFPPSDYTAGAEFMLKVQLERLKRVLDKLN